MALAAATISSLPPERRRGLLPVGRRQYRRGAARRSPQKEVTMTYLKDYTAKYNEPVSAFGGYSWDALHLVVDALRAVGGDKAKIRDHIENRQNFIGQQGIYNFSPQDHNGLTKDAFQMVVVKDGDWALVE
jgi:branched-chain amino acid transport system substrate-binding protein